jgi:hypothetical protein
MSQHKELESVYQDMACVIDKGSYLYKIIDDKYPNLIIKHEHTGEEYEIIIKKVKSANK